MLNYFRPIKSTEMDVASDAGTFREGAVLVESQVGGKTIVKPCTGSGTELFAGVSVNWRMMPTLHTHYEEITATAGGSPTITLSFTPAGAIGTIYLYNLTENQAVGGSPSLSGNVITLDAGEAEDLIRVSYAYTPSATHARLLQGDNRYPNTAGAAFNKTGVLQEGEIETSYFDPSVNWWASAISDIQMASGGRFTRGGSGSALSKCRVRQAPSVNRPFLHLYIAL